MSSGSTTSGGGGLTTLIGGIVAFCNTSQFIGWAGAGKSLLVGVGTSFAGGVLAFGCAAAGGAAGYLSGKFLEVCTLGKVGRLGKGLAVGGAIIGGILGFGAGVYQGYNVTKGWLTNTNEICAPVKAEQKVSLQQAQVPTTVASFSAGKLNFSPS